MISLRRNTTGDTIVEVLMALAVVGLILGGAYVTANRSLLTDDDTQEHTQALTLAQSQVDNLLDAASAGSLNTSNMGQPGGATCYDPKGTPTSSCYIPDNNLSTFAASCPPAVDFCYKVNVVANPVSASMGTVSMALNNYTVSVNWERLNGGQNQIQLFYQPGQ